MASRLDTVRRRLADLGADAALLTFLPDIRWVVGFTGSNGVLLVTPGATHFITDGRYRAQAEREVEGAEIHVPGYKLFEYIAEHALLGEAGTCVVQGDHLTPQRVERQGQDREGSRLHLELGLLEASVRHDVERSRGGGNGDGRRFDPRRYGARGKRQQRVAGNRAVGAVMARPQSERKLQDTLSDQARRVPCVRQPAEPAVDRPGHLGGVCEGRCIGEPTGLQCGFRAQLHLDGRVSAVAPPQRFPGEEF
ncbi:MAG: aminopeptidase P family N-terminal domain-containing protein [Bacteroidetes bacterium]|nr:aminopeptidase P family N-terminal domain-containing protein [Bacteroidota bacterium]